MTPNPELGQVEWVSSHLKSRDRWNKFPEQVEPIPLPDVREVKEGTPPFYDWVLVIDLETQSLPQEPLSFWNLLGVLVVNVGEFRKSQEIRNLSPEVQEYGLPDLIRRKDPANLNQVLRERNPERFTLGCVLCNRTRPEGNTNPAYYDIYHSKFFFCLVHT